MNADSVLITGGAGFVGSALARALRRERPLARIVCFDNLHRRGSELNLPVLKALGVEFHHGDVRQPGDLASVPGRFDVLIEASAEPSVHAGTTGSPDYLLGSNLHGALHCLEFARQRCGVLVFLSTSRVYSIAALQSLPVRAQGADLRLHWQPDTACAGASAAGISEDFETRRARSLYGSSKLAAELFVQEYAQTYGLKAIINRCGVLAGPGQFGRVDQGVFTLWLAHHRFGLPLRYTGFGGSGLQVRDLLHPDDLYRLLGLQLEHYCTDVQPWNVGGGVPLSVSLAELTGHARALSGGSVPIASVAATAAVDVPWYISDCRAVQAQWGWQPRISLADLLRQTWDWLLREESTLRPLFGG